MSLDAGTVSASVTSWKCYKFENSDRFIKALTEIANFYLKPSEVYSSVS